MFIYKIKEICIEEMNETNRRFYHWLKEEGSNIYIYVCLVILLLFLSIVLYRKWKYPFWNTLPMFHTYDYCRYLIRTPQIICKKPFHHKITEQIKTYNYAIITEQKETILDLIKRYYLTTEYTFHTLSIKDLDTIMTGQLIPSYISVLPNELGCITSRTYTLFLPKWKVSYSLYYLDFLSVPKETKDKEKTSLIQAHLSQIRQRNPSVLVSLFKTEGKHIDGLVPFVKYNTFFFSLNSSMGNVMPLLNDYTVVRIYKENKEGIQALITEIQSSNFDIAIVGDIPNILALIQQHLLYAYLLKKQGEIIGYYFVQVERIEWENEQKSIRLIASWNKTASHEIFYRGYLLSIKDILREGYNILKIDDISDNSVLLSRWRMNHPSFTTLTNAYYFYNFIFPYQTVVRCFILM